MGIVKGGDYMKAKRRTTSTARGTKKKGAARVGGARAKTRSVVRGKARGGVQGKARSGVAKSAPKVEPIPTTVLGPTVSDVRAPSTGMKTVHLKDHLGQTVVLYFYPKDLTPGCTIEGREFTHLKEDFATQNAVVYGVSRDTVDLHEKFKQKECYTIDLLSDTNEKLCNRFGVLKDKNMYGKIVRGIERSTFVIDPTGKVIKEWRGVKAEGHAQEVLTYLKQRS